MLFNVCKPSRACRAIKVLPLAVYIFLSLVENKEQSTHQRLSQTHLHTFLLNLLRFRGLFSTPTVSKLRKRSPHLPLTLFASCYSFFLFLFFLLSFSCCFSFCVSLGLKLSVLFLKQALLWGSVASGKMTLQFLVSLQNLCFLSDSKKQFLL